MKRVFKIFCLLVCVALTASMLFSCVNRETKNTEGVSQTPAGTAGTAEKTNIRVAGLKGPTGLGMSKLMSDSEKGETANDYTFSLSTEPTEIVAKITTGEVDVAAVPTNLAATLYNRTNGNVQLAALNTLGVLYIIENGNEINSIQDLKGKTVYASGLGSTPEYIFNFILKQNGIDPENDLELIYASEHAEVVALCASDKASIALLPEPNVTTVLNKNTKFRVALDVTEEYENACESAGIKDNFLAMGCIVVNKEFAEKNKDAFEKFLDEYKASAEYVNENIDEAASFAVKYEIIGSEDIAKKAIPNCNITYIDGDEMKTGIKQFYSVLFEAQPSSVGGSLPGDDFYYEKK